MRCNMIEGRCYSVLGPRPDLEADRLWPQARRLAEQWCAIALNRLRRGDGGFYEADDLLQDLYIEFRDTIARWRADGAGDDEQALWSAWSRRLWSGGQRVLRRQPQHLWVRQEEPMDPTELSQAAETLTTESDASPVDTVEVSEALSSLDRLDAALWSLPVLNRQVVYMLCLRRRHAADIAQQLSLPGPKAVYGLLRDARRRLRRALDRPAAAAGCSTIRDRS
jgi:DNA-directed RNA polymerase specialized sigma24 family protein